MEHGKLVALVLMKLENRDQNAYYITNKRQFKPSAVRPELINLAFDFAYQMIFGEGHHRSHRSGGIKDRKNGELFANTFQGKLAEYLVYEELKRNQLPEVETPDTSIYGKGRWDDSDLEYKGKRISIKSAAYFANLLLLEAKDWNAEGEYIPNLHQEQSHAYDYFVLVRIKPDIKRVFRKSSIYYSNSIDKETLMNLILQQSWFYDYGGICTQSTIRHIINNRYLIPQFSKLNGSVEMDADNYYIQAGDLKEFSFLVQELRLL